MNKYATHKSHGKRPLAFRSRITNGQELLPGIDGRSCWARRFRDLIVEHTADRGGTDNCSEGERALIRRAAAIIVECERLEVRFAANEGAALHELDAYQRAANSLRRLLETLGIKREAKVVNHGSDGDPAFDRFVHHLADVEDVEDVP